ncbi:MAG: hypothetical protein H6712_34265 [Myxococcales bacterium]|nr:hypothetical protein [Myxococcales bacterium]MCB9718960.1 hypothetical protein [Myxococcales bacterium]
MLQYFGFYETTPPPSPELDDERSQAEAEDTQRRARRSAPGRSLPHLGRDGGYPPTRV